MADILRARTLQTNCSVCGKLTYIEVPGMWVYKLKDNRTSEPFYQCSYSCHEKAKAAYKAQFQKPKKKRKQAEDL